MARVSLAPPLETRAGNNTKDSRAINGILESAGDQAGVIKRPGNSGVGSVTSGTSQLLAEFNSKAVTVIGDSLKTNTVSPFGTDSTAALSPLYGSLGFTRVAKGQVSNDKAMFLKTSKEAWVLT
jgi:hypothetical protein